MVRQSQTYDATTIGRQIAPLRFEEYTYMPLINLVFALIVIGVALWLINRYIPMASSIKTILNVVVVVAVGVWVLQAVGLWGDVTAYRVGR
jgi:predicted membrane protein